MEAIGGLIEKLSFPYLQHEILAVKATILRVKLRFW